MDDQWVIGTEAEYDLKGYADRFYNYVSKKYKFKGKIVRKEGFASPLVGGVYLGKGDILLCGDGAGLLDAYQGVAMDNAALGARFTVQALIAAERNGEPEIRYYRQKMGPMKKQVEFNEIKRVKKFASDESLSISMAPRRMMIDGVKMLTANVLNRVLPPDKVITLPL